MQMEAQLQESDTESASGGSTKANDDFKEASSAYKDLVSRLQLNSFVFWGDNEMFGNEKGSLPKSFGEVSNGDLLALLSEPFGGNSQIIRQADDLTVTRFKVKIKRLQKGSRTENHNGC